MGRMRKIISIALVFLICIFMLAGCKTSNTDRAESTVSDGKKVLGEDKVVDMEGYEFTVATAWLRNNPPRNATTFERLWHQQKEKVQKEYNCKITIVNFYASMEGMIPKMLAGDKVGDVVHMIADMWLPAVGAGYLRPWEDVSDVINLNDARWLFSADATAINGKHYVLEFERPGDIGTVLWYNKDVLKKAGISEDPAQLALEGKWTWDKFREMLKACTMDTNNDGKKDVFGIASFTGYSDIAFALARSNGAGILEPDGKRFKKSYETPEFMEAINFYDTLVNTDKVFRIYDNMTSEETWTNMPSSDTIFNEFRNGTIAFLSARMWIGNQQLKPYMENSYGMVVYPKGPKANDYILDAQTLGGFALTTTNKDYKKSAIIFNALAHPVEGYEDEEVMNETIASDFFQDGDTLSFKMYELAKKKVKLDFGYGVQKLFAEVNHAIIQSVFWHIDTPAAAIEGLKGLNDEEITNTYKHLYD